MIHRELSKSGIQISALGMGTWAIGGTAWGGTDEVDSIAALQCRLDEGINLIDTAPGYGLGLAEEFVGKAIKGRKREDIRIGYQGRTGLAQRGGKLFLRIKRHTRLSQSPSLQHTL